MNEYTSKYTFTYFVPTSNVERNYFVFRSGYTYGIWVCKLHTVSTLGRETQKLKLSQWTRKKTPAAIVSV